MTEPVIKATTLVTSDGVPIDAVHRPGPGDLGIVVAHGFTLNWQRPAVWQAATRLNTFGGVVSFDFRGHGRSGGVSTVGDQEIKDLAVAVAYARELGYPRIATVGFSMGASIVLRHAGLAGGVDAVVAVSGPGHWYYRGTRPMRRVHFGIERRVGRLILRNFWGTRISNGRWDPDPMPPAEAAALIAPTPLLIVHGDQDPFFPVDHAQEIYAGAREPRDLWIVPGFGHAEAGSQPALLDRIGGWLRAAAGAQALAPAAPDAVAPNVIA
jgi:pimeloyl-ACP methyl ester carboxylesterase